MTKKESRASVLGQMADELKLQAHLARMERAEPSEGDADIHEEASSLAQLRDSLRVQIHLGELEAKKEWHDAEERWRHFIQRTVRPTASDIAEDVQVGASDLLGQIRDGYKKLVGN